MATKIIAIPTDALDTPIEVLQVISADLLNMYTDTDVPSSIVAIYSQMQWVAGVLEGIQSMMGDHDG